MRSPIILKTAGVVVLLWAIVFGAIHFLHLLQPTSVSIGLWAHRQQLSSLSAEDRASRINSLADQINQLSFAERQKVFQNVGFQSFSDQLSDEEKLSLMDKTLSKGMAQLMEALNRMKPEERQRVITQALNNMKQRDENDPNAQNGPNGMNNPAMQKVIQTGFNSYLQNASAQTKLDCAPLVEQIQIDMQGVMK